MSVPFSRRIASTVYNLKHELRKRYRIVKMSKKQEIRIAEVVYGFYSRLLSFLQASTCNFDEAVQLMDVANGMPNCITLDVRAGALRRYHDSFHTQSVRRNQCHHIYQAAFRDLSRKLRERRVRLLIEKYDRLMNNLPNTPQQRVMNIKRLGDDGPGIVTLAVSSVQDYLRALSDQRLTVSISVT